MESDQLVDHLEFLVENQGDVRSVVAGLDTAEIEAITVDLKQRALFYLRREGPKALAIADLIFNIGEWSNNPNIRALGLQTKATTLTISQREFETALRLYEESEAIYKESGADLEIALGQVSRVWALACLQRYEEAFATAAWTEKVLSQNNAYRALAALNNNLAAIYGRRGQDEEALERIERVEKVYALFGEEGQRRLPLALANRAIVLRNLGRFEESLAANEKSLQMATEFHQTANVARAEQNLGMTYFLIGRFNKAHALLEKARDTFISDQRYGDAVIVDLFISDGLLSLGRFEEALAKSREIREKFQLAGTQFELAQAILNEATALTGLEAYVESIAALKQARRIFVEEENEAWQIYTDLEVASVLYRRQKYSQSEKLAAFCALKLSDLNLLVKKALALVLAARSALAQHHYLDAQDYIAKAQEIAHSMDVPILAYQTQYLTGQLAATQGDRMRALSAYDAAIRELERLQGQIMVEFRSDFLADKNEVYTYAVDLCLDAGNPEIALSYAERAKSRALLAMLAHHVNLRIEARSPADQELVDRILHLRELRDRLYRRWETGETPGSTANREEEQKSGQVERNEARQMILKTEDNIRDLWHRLLVRNNAYAQDASLWQVQSTLNQSALDEETLLVEFFDLPDGMVVFLISTKEVKAHRLPVSYAVISRLQFLLHHNFNTVQKAPQYVPKYIFKAQTILNQLYNHLAAPWIAYAAEFQNLIIVPHGPLHYIPFHALFDGQRYLLERFQVSYLPGSSFLSKSQSLPLRPLRSLVMGHKQNDYLQYIEEEVLTVAATLKTRPYLDREATRKRFQETAPRCDVIHLATHGDFRPRNPLFSGLYLDDSLLTTLDIFNLRLQASLVTLSACQTGRNVISGGDELQGLTRAFLASGASSLILSLWPVDDKATTMLMSALYHDLIKGQTKADALRHIQIQFIEGKGGLLASHPYYWAPFFLVGNTGSV